MFDADAGYSKKHLVGLLARRWKMTLLLIFLILSSLVFESVGLAMMLPVLEQAIGVDSETRLSGLLVDFYMFLGLENSLSNVVIIFVAVMLLKNILVVLREALRTYYAYSYKREAMLSINKALLYMDYSDFQNERQGHLINDTVTASQHATLFLIQFIEFVTSILAVLAFIAVMFLADALITVVMIAFGILFFIVTKFTLGGYGKRVGMKEVSVNQTSTDYLAESITLMRDFRLNLLEQFQLQRMKSMFDKIVRLEVKWNAVTASIQPFIEMIMVAMFGGYIIYLTADGGVDQFKERLPSLGVIVILAHRMFVRASQISRTHVSIIRYFVPFMAVSRYLDFPFSKSYGVTDVNFSNDIIVDSITVKSGDRNVINSANMVLPGGKVTGIIGETGSGKSTIVDLLLRLRKLDAGKIKIDNTNILDVDLSLLRTKISVVSQAVALRNATVIDNIRTGNLDSTDDDIYQISKKLGLHEFILSLPQGYQTIVGDRGSLLSGGQAQRVLIARALLRSPDILVLDEFTSALDADTEELINSKLMKMMSNKTVIVITHRESVLKYCTKVFSIDDGEIITVR